MNAEANVPIPEPSSESQPQPEQVLPRDRAEDAPVQCEIGCGWKPGSVFLKVGDRVIRFPPGNAERLGRDLIKMAKKARR